MIDEVVKLILLFIYAFSFLYFIKKEKRTVLYATIVFVNFGILTSLILIEYGMFIYEQQITGFENNSFYVFFVYSISSLLLFHFLSLKKSFLITDFRSKEKNVFIIISLIFCIVLLYSIYNNPDYTRFDIFNGPFKMIFVRIEYLFAFVFIYSLFRTRKVNKKTIIFFIYCMLMYLRGSQFGAFMIATIWLFTAFYLEKGKLNIKWILIFSVLLIIPFAIKVSLNDLLVIFQRIVMEGHVFWGTINQLNQNGSSLDFSGFISNYNDLLSGFQQGNIEYGFGKLMHEISPHFAEMSLKAGVRFAAGYPAILLYHFGSFFGIIFHLFFTYIYFLLMQYLIYCFKYKDVFFSYIIYMFYMIYNDFMIQGEYAHFRVKFLIKVVIISFIVFLYKNYSKNKKLIVATN